MKSFKFFVAALVLFISAFQLEAANSLKVINPRYGSSKYSATIEQMVVTANPRGAYIEYGIYLTFSSRGSGYEKPTDSLEIEFLFDLPKDIIFNDAWLWIDNKAVRARLIDRWTASSIYEGIVKRRRDPLLIMKNSMTSYELRIFPLPGNQTRKIKINYMVPATWGQSQVTSELPFNFIQTSKNTPILVKFLCFKNDEFGAPTITDNPNVIMYEQESQEYGTSYEADIPPSQAVNTKTLAFTSPMKDGVYLNTSKFGDKGYYQMIVSPALALNFNYPKNVLILIDQDSRKTSITPDNFLNNLKSTLLNYFTPADKFNIIFGGIISEPISQDWIAADAASIENTFAHLTSSNFSSFSNLLQLLVNGIEYSNLSQDTTDQMILLISSSDQYGAPEVANDLLDQLLALQKKKVPINVAAYGNSNLSYNQVGSINYYGNEYFNINLAKMTGGIHQKIQSFGQDFSKLINTITQNLNGLINSFEIYNTMSDGFCYGRYNLNSTGISSYYGQVVQVGMFTGNFPFEINATGFHKNKAFMKKITINENQFANSDCLNNILWTAAYIRSLEVLQPQTNDVVTEIIQQSMDNRILSIYTAFLALEPTDTTQYKQGEGEDDDINTEVAEKALPVNDVQIKVYPNPVTVSASIALQLPEGIDASQVDIKLFNLNGTLVRSFGPVQNSGNTISLSWKGEDDSGRRLASGTYLIVVTTPKGRFVQKIILI